MLKTDPYTVNEQRDPTRVEIGLNAIPICVDDSDMVLTPLADKTVFVGVGFPTEAADNRFVLKV